MVILGIDQATTSGWCILEREGGVLELVSHGTATSPKERRQAARQARQLAGSGGHIIVAMEEHSFGNKFSMSVLQQMRGRWLEQVESCVSSTQTLELRTATPSQWRKYHGAPKLEGARAEKRKQAKSWAIETVERMFGAALTDDEAEAILIGLYCDTVEPGCAKRSRRRKGTKS